MFKGKSYEKFKPDRPSCKVCAFYRKHDISNAPAPLQSQIEEHKHRANVKYRTSYACAGCSQPHMGDLGTIALHPGQCFREYHDMPNAKDKCYELPVECWELDSESDTGSDRDSDG